MFQSSYMAATWSNRLYNRHANKGCNGIISEAVCKVIPVRQPDMGDEVDKVET